jgi:hypothetical protein
MRQNAKMGRSLAVLFWIDAEAGEEEAVASFPQSIELLKRGAEETRR